MRTAVEERLVRERVERAGQGHVFRFWDRLDRAGRQRLLEQLADIDFDLLEELVERVRRGVSAEVPEDLEPAPVVPLPRSPAEVEEARRAEGVGEEVLRAGRVAVLLVAGGQASRLRWPGPKGTFPIGPVSGKSLFQLQTEKVLAARARYRREIPLLIMTSPANDRATRLFFQQHDYFGMPAEEVWFFRQGTMPVVDFSGRLLLEAPDRVAESPNGHGGVFAALRSAGLLNRLHQRNIDIISYIQVDNCLVKAVDPVFIGRHILAGAEMSSKVCRKRDPDEPVGVVVRRDGGVGVVEYSDLPDHLKRARRPDGRLRFEMGSIAIHLLQVEFAERVAREAKLPFHLARKRVPCLDPSGGPVEPVGPNAVKFEMFIFDALPLARSTVTMETLREEEFAPVKNAEGEDSPATAREMMIAWAARWLEREGCSVPRDSLGRPRFPLEISPLFEALEPTERAERLRSADLTGPCYLAP